MLARLARELPVGDYLYEPKWDGFRALAARSVEEVDVRSRHGRPLARYFPEIVEALLEQPAPSFVLDGELVAHPFPALMARLHPAASRVERLARETPAELWAFDLLALDGEDLLRTPFETRRARLETFVRRPVRLTPVTDDPAVARAWLAKHEGVLAKARDGAYAPGKREWVKVKRDRTADCVVAGFRWNADRPTLGSLLLGLHDDAGALVKAEQQRAERRAVGVPAEPGDDAVGGAVALHLHPLALPRRIAAAARLRQHALVLD